MIAEAAMVASTETEELRKQLLQAQRLSSVGALASSVAHEFNNILTTVINYAKMALRANEDEVARTQALEKILKGSQRAATIINSMLGFARNSSRRHSTSSSGGGVMRKESRVRCSAFSRSSAVRHRSQPCRCCSSSSSSCAASSP